MVKVRVSDYDLTRGVPAENVSSAPNPHEFPSGQNTWSLIHTVRFSPATQDVTHRMVTAANLMAEVGVAPRRAGNTYAVAEVNGPLTGGVPGDYTSIAQTPIADLVPMRRNQTITFSKWVYIKTAGTPVVNWGMGIGLYDENFDDSGGMGDSASGTIPLNQWFRASEEHSWGSLSAAYFNTAITVNSGGFVAGDVIISTDYMQDWSGLNDYFDGDFADSDNTTYEWTGLPGVSTSTKRTETPSSVTLFPPMNVTDYAVSEDAMSPDPSNFTGGYGSITFGILPDPDRVLIRGKVFELEDGDKGITTGIVTNLNATETDLSVSTDSMLGVLNAWNTVPGMAGTLQQFVESVFGIVGLTLPVQYEGGVEDIEVIGRTWVGNLWDMMKQFLSAYSVEMALVHNSVVFRPYRTYEAYTGRLSASGWNVSQGETAKIVEVTYYENEFANFDEFYPVKYNDPDYNPTIMQVNAGETIEYVIQLAGTVTEMPLQPFPEYTIGNDPQVTSKYSVTGGDDLPVQPQQWMSAGGSLTVRINEDDPSTATVTVKGANIPHLAPFRIAMSSGGGNYYNSLHIVATGIKYEPKTIQIHTGASSDTTGTEVGITVDNPYIQTKDQALNVGVYTAARFSGLDYTINGTAWDINRRGYTGGLFSTVADFNNSWIGTETIEDFNVRYAGQSILQFNTLWDEARQGQFAVQAFGNAAGARVKMNDAYFRIIQATFNPADMAYTAELDTMVEDFNEAWNGATVSDFNDEMFNKLIRDYSVIPLRRIDG